MSKLSLSDKKSKSPVRRGRGTFTYRKHGLYSDEQADEYRRNDSSDKVVVDKPEKVPKAGNLYGTKTTNHVLVLDGLNPSTTMPDLEKFFQDFKDGGFTIRWVNDTLALAVFRTLSIGKRERALIFGHLICFVKGRGRLLDG